MATTTVRNPAQRSYPDELAYRHPLRNREREVQAVTSGRAPVIPCAWLLACSDAPCGEPETVPVPSGFLEVCDPLVADSAACEEGLDCQSINYRDGARAECVLPCDQPLDECACPSGWNVVCSGGYCVTDNLAEELPR